MAFGFGFGFKKQKVLSAAEKCVQQGKLQNAISEYEKILKNDPKDLTVLNTVGDLYSRLGETDKAAECFKNVGDAYAAQGFTVKAIAMYKKLSKLKPSTECVLRLAELYTQQGLFNDARAQYLQVAEEFLKSGQFDQAVRIFEKTLEMDPENIPMRKRLAEVYIKLGRKSEAWKILSTAAESLRNKGQLGDAEEILKRMLKLEPGNSYALLLRGRAALDAGDTAAAIAALSQVGDLDSNAEGLRTLFQAYLRAGNFPEAGALAQKLAEVHNDSTVMSEYADELVEAHEYREALAFYDRHSDELLQKDPSKIVERLRPIISQVQDDPQGLEAVLHLFQKAGESTHLTEIYELLAHAYVQSGDLEKARDFYLKLTQLEPANPMHSRNYQQVLEKLGGSDTPHLISAEEGAMLVDELEATAPFIDQRYDDDVALAVRSALTDAELYISYNMAAKAAAPLLSALPNAPRDLRLNQKLAALHTRAGRFREAAACCRTLESVYHESGYSEEAARYADLAANYEEQRTGGTTATTPQQAKAPQAITTEFEISSPASEPIAEVAPATPVVETPLPTPGAPNGLFFHGTVPSAPPRPPSISANSEVPRFAFDSHHEPAEIDLSGEWEDGFSVDAPEVPQAELPQAELSQAEFPPYEISHEAPESPGLPHIPLSSPPVAEAKAVTFKTQPVPAASEADLAELIEEVRFYLGQGMTEQAEHLLGKLEALSPQLPEVAVFRLGIESAKHAGSTLGQEAEISIEEAGAIAEATPDESETPDSRPGPSHENRPVLAQIASEIEQALGSGFTKDGLPADTVETIETTETNDTTEPAGATEIHAATDTTEMMEVAPATADASSHEFRAGTLDDFVADLEASLGDDFLHESDAEPAPPAVPAAPQRVEQPAILAAAAAAALQSTATPQSQPHTAPVATSQPAVPIASALPRAEARVPPPPPRTVSAPVSQTSTESLAGVDLSNLFGDLKQELEGEVASADEDPETHYNLGVAFREMGLLDEAIAEFQKVCQSAERGHSFPQLMQTYTWLAQCFLDKGIPEAAIRWYEKALKLPTLDQETRTALHYELASSFEVAGNNAAALSNFLEVYGSNIDYRDVAERIKALRP